MNEWINPPNPPKNHFIFFFSFFLFSKLTLTPLSLKSLPLVCPATNHNNSSATPLKNTFLVVSKGNVLFRRLNRIWQPNLEIVPRCMLWVEGGERWSEVDGHTHTTTTTTTLHLCQFDHLSWLHDPWYLVSSPSIVAPPHCWVSSSSSSSTQVHRSMSRLHWHGYSYSQCYPCCCC